MPYRNAAGQFVGADTADADRAGTTRDGERIVRIDDIRRAGHCVRGARDWFEAHNLDFKAFLRDGIDADAFIATGDAMAQMIVDSKTDWQ